VSVKKELPTARIVGREDITDDLMKMWLEPPVEFQGFQAGQYCTIGVGRCCRPYSIASAPGDPLELFLELIPPERRTPKSVTPKLWEKHPGDMVTFFPKAKGTFLFNLDYRIHVMIATVTGVAPYMSMLRTLDRRKQIDKNINIFLFDGASYQDEFGYLQELRCRHLGYEIIFIPTISRPYDPSKQETIRNKGWQGQTGRVNLIVEKYLDYYGITPEDTLVYLCGNENMIDDLGNTEPTEKKPIGKLIARGYTVRQEVFF
jgi:ferredoxin--NADP+ reductase